MIVVRLPMPPSAGSRFAVYKGRMILTAKARAWKQSAEWDVRKQYQGQPIKGRVQVTLTLHPAANKDGSARRRVMDRDNACKATLDALNGIVYMDDSQIDPLIVTKGECKPQGGVTLEVIGL